VQRRPRQAEVRSIETSSGSISENLFPGPTLSSPLLSKLYGKLESEGSQIVRFREGTMDDLHGKWALVMSCLSWKWRRAFFR